MKWERIGETFRWRAEELQGGYRVQLSVQRHKGEYWHTSLVNRALNRSYDEWALCAGPPRGVLGAIVGGGSNGGGPWFTLAQAQHEAELMAEGFIRHSQEQHGPPPEPYPPEVQERRRERGQAALEAAILRAGDALCEVQRLRRPAGHPLALVERDLERVLETLRRMRAGGGLDLRALSLQGEE